MSRSNSGAHILKINDLPQTVFITKTFINGTCWLNNCPISFDVNQTADLYIQTTVDNNVYKVVAVVDRAKPRGIIENYKLRLVDTKKIGDSADFEKCWR
tara:strand:- start:248 stop:544 length:297 start_codon:yes stop_codon:yes gene_type:complete